MPHELPEVGAKVVLHERDQGDKTDVKKETLDTTKNKQSNYTYLPQTVSSMHASTHAHNTHTHAYIMHTHIVLRASICSLVKKSDILASSAS